MAPRWSLRFRPTCESTRGPRARNWPRFLPASQFATSALRRWTFLAMARRWPWQRLAATIGAVKVWNVAGGELIRELRVPGCPMVIAFSPDGKQLALGPVYFFGNPGEEPESGAPLRVFDIATGKETVKLSGHSQS